MGLVKQTLIGLTFVNAVNVAFSSLLMRKLRSQTLKDDPLLNREKTSEVDRFASLEQCETAYDKLWDECKATDVEATSDQSKADNGGYEPPEGRTGRPNREKGYDYKEHGSDWSKFGQCHGPNQSPVDISQHVDIQGQTKYVLWFDYYLDPDLQPDHKAMIVNDGHGLRFDVPSNDIDMGYVKIGKTEYTAMEYQFHAPSEHTINGAVFPLEMQIYNFAHDDTGIVAISIFFREGESNPFLASLRQAAGGQDGPTWGGFSGKTRIDGRFTGAFDLENVIPRGDVSKEAPFFNYKGSLTQPPCTEGVDWWLLSKPITASRDEIRFIRKSIFKSVSSPHGNARETQSLGNRKVFVGLTGFQHKIKGHVNLQGWKDKDEVQDPRGYNSGDLPWGGHWGPDGLGAPGPAPGGAPAASPAA